jgi:hypothetical protein
MKSEQLPETQSGKEWTDGNTFRRRIGCIGKEKP